MASWTRATLLGVVLLVAPAALAEGLNGPDKDAVFLSTGLLFSGSHRPRGLMGGIGVEMSVHGYPADGFGVGLFGQWQSMDLQHHRVAGGMQFSRSLAGLELGVAREGPTAGRAATTLMHIAPYASIGVASLALRFGIPIHTSDTGLPGYGYDVGLVLAIKAPVPLSKDW